ncbi:hypothetical protein [Euzebya rosea]|uniref:hypothetical protein n=1 Tax=Euzebya rosea TaxID=2052804 RepID=UPI0013007497|nr:hypothetical protein [Euzebya rosea]
MRTFSPGAAIRRPAVAFVAAAALVGAGTVLPVGADTTALTLSLTNSGTLSIDAPAAASATTDVTSTSGVTATIPVNGIVITDGRALPGVFTATATSSDLTSGANTISNAGMIWLSTSATTGGGSAAPGILRAGGALSGNAIVAIGLGLGLGASSYTINGTITVPITGKSPGDYTGTLTTSIN